MVRNDFIENSTIEHIQSSSSLTEGLSPNSTLTCLESHIPKLHTVDSVATSLSSKSYITDIEPTNTYIIADHNKTTKKDYYNYNHNNNNTISRENTRECNNDSSSDLTDYDDNTSNNISEKDSKYTSDDNNNNDDDDYPEGGLKAWVVVFGCFLGLIACFGILNTTGVIENYLQNHQLIDENSSSIGWIFSLFLFMTFASCIFSGTYFDRNGFKDPVILGSILLVGGLFATANSTKIWHFILSLSIVAGFGNGLILSPLVSCPAHYFKRKRGTASALATVGGSVGGGLFPLLLRKLFSLESPNNPFYGFIWGIRTLAFISLALLSLSLCLVKERLPHVEIDRSSKEPRWRYLIRVYIIESFDARAFRDLRYLFCVVGTCFGEVSLSSVITYFGAYAVSKGISQSDSYMLIMVINLTGIPGRWVPGALSDSFGRFNVAIGTLVSLGIIMLVGWLPFCNDLNSLYVISALYGFFSGSIFSLLPVCCGQISKTEDFGKRYSTMYFCVSFATLVGVPITGAIIGNETEANYQHYKIFCAVTTLFSAFCFFISRYFAVGLKWKKF